MENIPQRSRQNITPEAPDASSLQELHEKKDRLLELAHDAKTLQELVWYTEAMEVGSGKNAKVLSDSGESLSAKRLAQEITNIDVEEERGAPEEQAALRQIRPLFQKVIELRSTRMEFNALYRDELVVRTTPKEDEFFGIHAVNRETYNKEKNLPPPEDTTPIMIALGYSTGDIAARRNAISLAELGRSVATFDLPPQNKYFDTSLNYPPNTPDFTKVHVTALLRSLEESDKKVFNNPDGKYDVMAYSVGAINTIKAAMIRPEKFRKILLVNPAGLTFSTDPYWKRYKTLATNAFNHRAQVLSEAGKKPMTFADRMALLYNFEWGGDIDPDANKPYMLHTEFSEEMEAISKKGGWKMPFKVADAISRTDLVPMIQHLQSLGIKIGVLPAEHDPLFPEQQIEASGKRAGVDVFPAVGAHANLGFNPAGMAHLYIDFLAHMDEPLTREEETHPDAA